MKTLITVCLLLVASGLVGCGGASFEDGFGPLDEGGGDAGPAAGGSPESAGGRASGGAPGAFGGANAGGQRPAAGGGPSSIGGASGAGGASIGGASAGGASSAGGVSSAGGASSAGGEPVAGGRTGSGGHDGFGGATAGGAPDAAGGEPACDLVTHDNGVGQTWQDCVPLFTYDEEQARKACEASGAASCILSERCGPAVYEVQGFAADGTTLVAEWGYGNFAAGHVSPTYSLCSPGDPANKRWK